MLEEEQEDYDELLKTAGPLTKTDSSEMTPTAVKVPIYIRETTPTRNYFMYFICFWSCWKQVLYRDGDARLSTRFVGSFV